MSKELAVVNAPKILTDKEYVENLKKENFGTSQIIRRLGVEWKNKDGESDRSRIVKALINGGVRTKEGGEIRYQHVRNVLITPIKKG